MAAALAPMSPASLDEGFFGQMARGLMADMELDLLSATLREKLSEVLRFASTAEIEIARRHERARKLEGMALIDDVTGLENQRGLQIAFERAVAAAERYNEQGVMILFAIHGLEDINETHGASAEALMVRAIAQTIRSQIRQSDIPARLSRDEFSVLLPRCPAEVAAPKAAGIAQALTLLGLSFGDSLLAIEATSGAAPFGRGSLFDHCLGAAQHAVARTLAGTGAMTGLPGGTVAQLAATH
jgi:diguanylate cyclase (GGDEF)-like protein